MRRKVRRLRPSFLGIVLTSGLMCIGSAAVAQQGGGGGSRQPPPGLPEVSLPDEPIIINTHEIAKVRLSVVTRGLSHPWALAFLPDGRMLVTERQGRLRMIRAGVLDPEPIAGVPTDVLSRSLSGMMEVAIDPDFEHNHLVYLTYTRQLGRRTGTVAVVRGRLEGMTLVDLEDIFVADAWGGSIAAARIAFTPDGFMFLAIGGGFGVEKEDGSPTIAAVDGLFHAMKAQDPNSHVGKLLRLRLDGTVPDDNPFVGRAGYKPEIYSMGHRNQQGLVVHPETGMPWATDHGPQGGDELNAIEPGMNYGWPLVSYGRQYGGPRISKYHSIEGLKEPFTLWVPSIAPSGLAFYTGDRFPAWKGDIFVGSLMTGRIRGTGHLERIELNAKGEEVGRESLLTDLRQRIRDVRQGPDGLLYLLTEESDGALIRFEPVPAPPRAGRRGPGRWPRFARRGGPHHNPQRDAAR